MKRDCCLVRLLPPSVRALGLAALETAAVLLVRQSIEVQHQGDD